MSIATPVFTAEERSALAVLADAIFPPDQDAGGSALGAVQYIETLLTAVDVAGSPMVFAGGPFSGRQPFTDGVGGPSSVFPANDFANFLPLDRVSQKAWLLYLYGSAGVAGGGPNDALFGPVIGLRQQVQTAVDQAMSFSPMPLATLDATDALAAFNSLSADQRSLLTDLVLEACFAPPEYGGNTAGAGWTICNFEGDSQPLGYSLFDTATMSYRERPDAPMSTPNPGPDPAPLTADTQQLLAAVTAFEGGTEFP